jgi:hypothetical protein
MNLFKLVGGDSELVMYRGFRYYILTRINRLEYVVSIIFIWSPANRCGIVGASDVNRPLSRTSLTDIIFEGEDTYLMASLAFQRVQPAGLTSTKLRSSLTMFQYD